MDEQHPDEESVDYRSAIKRAWDRFVIWSNWDRPTWDDMKAIYYATTGTEPYVDPGIDAVILRIAPMLADDAMPIILRHDPHKFGGFMDDGGMVIVTVEKSAGTHVITFRNVALADAKRGKALNALIAQAEEANPDVAIVREGILHPAVMVTVSLTDEEATAEAVNRAARRAAEVAEQVKAGRSGVSGVTVGFEYGDD